MTNIHICLSNDFIRFAFLSIRSIASLSPDEINALEKTREGWQSSRAHDFSNLLLMTKLVAWGVLFEGPELLYNIVKLIRRWLRKPVRGDHEPGWITLVGLIGWALVLIGVAGEFWVDDKVNADDDNIQSINIQLLRDANSSATAAAMASKEAQGAAKDAKGVSSDARTLAQGARKEADSFANEIANAKQQAADAVSRLADAEQRLADSSQKELAAERALRDIKSPRSLVHTDAIIAALKPFKATKYTFNVFQDEESIEFAKALDPMLQAAGWVRNQPQGVRIGVTSLKVFGNGPNDGTEVCVETGVRVHVASGKPLSELQVTPIQQLPIDIQAAAALRVVLSTSLLPQDAHNVGEAVEIEPPPAYGSDLRICVGRKP